MACGSARFIVHCLHSENYVIFTVACNGVYFSHAQSFVDRNPLFCCSLFKVPLRKLDEINKQLVFSVANHCIPDDCMYIINTIKEPLCVKHQEFELPSPYCNRHDIDCMIDFCVYCIVLFFIIILCILVRSHNNNNNIRRTNPGLSLLC